MKFKRETQMEEPVKQWMENYGYIVHRQSSLPSGFVPDLLGYSVDFESFMAIELKLDRFKDALMQAELYRNFCHFSYIAHPADRANRIFQKQQEVLIKSGIGLLSVDDDVNVIVPASVNLKADWKDLYCRFSKDIKKEHIKRAEKIFNPGAKG